MNVAGWVRREEWRRERKEEPRLTMYWELREGRKEGGERREGQAGTARQRKKRQLESRAEKKNDEKGESKGQDDWHGLLKVNV